MKEGLEVDLQGSWRTVLHKDRKGVQRVTSPQDVELGEQGKEAR